jgi:XTP/dITP diphosphohydrolase
MNNHNGSLLLIATNNHGKVRELQDLLKGTGIELITPSEINLDLDVIENGHTYAENAARKAMAFAQASRLISLADDSGLEVDALDGAPGLYSARYGSQNGEKLSDKDRRAHLIENLQDKPRPWTARFHATIAIAIPTHDRNHVILSEAKDLRDTDAETLRSPQSGSLRVTFEGGVERSGNENVYLAEGYCEGEIIPEERGSGGFGYDPIFLLSELGKTMAELSMEEKNRLSHRARAVMNAKGALELLFSNHG